MPVAPSQYSDIVGVVFDVDGTLLEDGLHRTKHIQVLQKLGLGEILPTHEEWARIAGISDRASYDFFAAKAERAGLRMPLSAEFYIRMTDRYFFTHMHKIKMREGAREILERVNRAELPKNICTNGPERETVHKLRNAGLEREFISLSCLEHAPKDRAKPFPYIYLHSFNKMQKTLGANVLMHTGQLLAIEDTDTGAKAALTAGYQVILWEHADRPSKMPKHPRLLITRDVNEILARLPKPVTPKLRARDTSSQLVA